MASLTRTNPDGSVVELYDGGDVPLSGSYTDMPTVPGNVTYSLVVSSEFGGTAVESVVVLVYPSVSSLVQEKQVLKVDFSGCKHDVCSRLFYFHMKENMWRREHVPFLVTPS